MSLNAAKTWRTYFQPKEVIPMNDINTHVFGPFCRCKPYRLKDTLVHNSYDRREFTDPKEIAMWAKSTAGTKVN